MQKKQARRPSEQARAGRPRGEQARAQGDGETQHRRSRFSLGLRLQHDECSPEMR